MVGTEENTTEEQLAKRVHRAGSDSMLGCPRQNTCTLTLLRSQDVYVLDLAAGFEVWAELFLRHLLGHLDNQF